MSYIAVGRTLLVGVVNFQWVVCSSSRTGSMRASATHVAMSLPENPVEGFCIVRLYLKGQDITYRQSDRGGCPSRPWSCDRGCGLSAARKVAAVLS